MALHRATKLQHSTLVIKQTAAVLQLLLQLLIPLLILVAHTRDMHNHRQLPATHQPVEPATSHPLEAATNHPVEAATNHPVEAATNHPVEAATSRPVEAATNRPVEAATNRPVEAATNRPVEAATNSRDTNRTLLILLVAREGTAVRVVVTRVAAAAVTKVMSAVVVMGSSRMDRVGEAMAALCMVDHEEGRLLFLGILVVTEILSCQSDSASSIKAL